jgi:phage terminase large subunit GpA-like protein
MADRDRRKFEVACPCCGARLTLDAELGKVIAHQAPPKHAKAPDLDHAGQLLEKEKARREALFHQSTEDEKIKSQVLERKFEESLEKAKQGPVTRPARDIDLD